MEDYSKAGPSGQSGRTPEEKNAIKKCLSLLEYRDRSKQQLREKLAGAGFSPGAVDTAVDYAEGFGYLDDRRFAENYVRTHCEKQSRMQMRGKLRESGVSEEYIDDALELYRDEEEQAAEAFLKSRTAALVNASEKEEQYAEKQKLIRKAMSKGFSYSTIISVLEKMGLTE